MMRRYLTSMFLLWVLLPLLGAVVCLIIGNEVVGAFGAIRIASMSLLIALGAASFSFRITWLPRLKEAYESVEHMENVSELRESDKTATYYGGFNRLAQALNALSTLAIASALVQLFLGMWQHAAAAGICMGSTVAVAISFLDMLRHLRRIEAAWIRQLDRVAEANHRSRTATVAR